MKLGIPIKEIHSFRYWSMSDSYSVQTEFENPWFMITGIYHSITGKPCKTFHILYMNLSQGIYFCFNIPILGQYGKANITIQIYILYKTEPLFQKTRILCCRNTGKRSSELLSQYISELFNLYICIIYFINKKYRNSYIL